MKTIIPNDTFLLPLHIRLQLFKGGNPISLVEEFCGGEEFCEYYCYVACRYQAAVHNKNSFNKFFR